MAPFGFGRPRPVHEHRGRVADWAREAAGLGADVVVKVNEIVCADPACPGTETVILVMPAGARSFARKIPKPVADVTQADVVLAFRTSG